MKKLIFVFSLMYALFVDTQPMQAAVTSSFPDPVPKLIVPLFIPVSSENVIADDVLKTQTVFRTRSSCLLKFKI